MLQLSFDFLSENNKKVVGDCRIFYLNQAEDLFKECICQYNDPLEWQIPQNLGWRKAQVEISLSAVCL